MGKTFTLFYLYDNLNKDNIPNGNLLFFDLTEFSEVEDILNRDLIKAPEELVNRIIALSRDKNF
ncbi:MAG: hypothetical protein V2I54_11220 [Bacteroidales bacterium]|nr:hypothetical protein [Bacteroidales bacterium]